MAIDSIPRRLRRQAEQQPDRPAYFVKSGNDWVPTSWAGYAAEARQVARALIALGVGPGTSVGILGFNRPEWTIFDLAALSIGAVPAGIYTTNAPPEVRYILHHAEASVVLVENRSQWEKVHQERERLPLLRNVVLMKGADAPDGGGTLGWEEFLAKGEAVSPAEVDRRIEALEENQVATLIYTSGTTGPPKGVMLTHGNLAWTAATAQQMTGVSAADRVLSYLPLSHIAEQMFTIHGAVTSGYSVYFAESIPRLADNLREVRPTLFFGVPRIWEKLHDAVAARLAEATGARRWLLAWARRVGTRATAGRCRGLEPSGVAALPYHLARRLVFSRIREALGLSHARLCISGAAPIGKDVLESFASLDILIHEVYGQSEDCGPTSFNMPGRTKLGSVGVPIPGSEVRIGDDGEILVRGPHVFKGYFKDPEATAAALTDGWLHSGDLGRFDEEGFLYVTGRKKDIIITAGGKNIAPRNIEAALKEHPLINEAVVIGDGRKYLTALVTLDPDAAAAFARERGIDPERVHESPALREVLESHLDRVNAELAQVEQIKKFTVLSRNLSIEAGELTPTMKVKRKVVQEHFRLEIERMYADSPAGPAAAKPQ